MLCNVADYQSKCKNTRIIIIRIIIIIIIIAVCPLVSTHTATHNQHSARPFASCVSSGLPQWARVPSVSRPARLPLITHVFPLLNSTLPF